MNALEAILSRRSTRRYASVMLEKALIEKVIEAGRYAPSGGNNQTTHFVVFTDKAEGGLPERTPLERKGNPVDWVQ